MQTRFIALLVVVLLGVGAGSVAAATTAPRNTVRPTISGTARQGDLLTADPGTWSGAQPMTFAYQWRRCDTNGANCSDIGGATSKTYTLTSADVGNKLRVRVRASNSAGSGTATSLPTAVVAGQPPQSLSLHTGRSSTRCIARAPVRRRATLFPSTFARVSAWRASVRTASRCEQRQRCRSSASMASSSGGICGGITGSA